MSQKPFVPILATLAFMFFAPHALYAQVPIVTVSPATIAAEAATKVVVAPQSILGVIQNTFSAIAGVANQLNTYAKWVNDYVLQPIAFIKSGALMKSLTAGVVAFVTGTANGTGVPQFVQDLQGNLQRVGDTQALAFFAQYARNSNSPFAASITSSLRSNYLERTSSAGFWSANRSTLNRYSPNVNGFLAGDWSQGGVGAWLALTTQPQNNPYMLYQASQAQLASVVGSAQATRSALLSYGQGFLSWCGADTGLSANPENVDPVLANEGGVSPGDPCINKDGTAGTIKTPGSVITASLNKALGGGQDKLVQIGNIGSQLSGILGSISNIMGTINLAKDILKGPASGGLAGAGNSDVFRAVGTSALEASVTAAAAASPAAANANVMDRIGRYRDSVASTTVDSLISVASTTPPKGP